MMSSPRINWVLFFAYLLAAIGIFAAALIFPGFRSVSYAPLRELVLPPPSPVVISLLYSTEKDAWLQDAVVAFNDTHPMVSGHPIQVQLEKMGSREIYLAVLDGSRKPTLISPSSILQIAILQNLSVQTFGKPVVNPADTATCRSLVTTPLVLVAWQDRVQVLWGNIPGADVWRDLQTHLVDPQGWGTLGHPDWGYIKFGHTNPLKSNSGFMTILLMAYDYYHKTSGLTANDITGNPDFQKWFLDFEQTISQFEESTGPLMQKMVTYGPSVYDIVAVYEATAIEQAQNAVGRYGALHIYYPPTTVWSDHPFCILDGDWVTTDQRQAAQVFMDFLSGHDMQQLAMMKYGFRPVDSSIKLDQPGSPFVVNQGLGLQTDLSNLPSLQPTDGNVLNILLDFWTRNISR